MPFEFPCVNALELGQCLADIYNFALILVGIAVVIQLIRGGWDWFTALGNPGKVKAGKEKILNAIIGFLIILASYLILNTINPDLLKGNLTLPGIQ